LTKILPLACQQKHLALVVLNSVGNRLIKVTQCFGIEAPLSGKNMAVNVWHVAVS
jgi:hypothetical protein